MERRILALTSVAHFFTHLMMLVYPTIAVIQARDWGVPVAELLFLTVPGFVLYGFAAIPVGMWSDRSGGWLPLTIGLLGMGGGALGCAYASGPTEIAIGLGVIGLFASTYHPAGLGLISQGMKRSSWALGVNGAIGSAAIAVAPGLAEVLSESFGWRGAFTILSVAPLVAGFIFLFLPIKLEQPPRAKEAENTVDSDSYKTLLNPVFIVLCVAITFNGIAYRGNTIVLPALMDDRVSFIGHGMATSLTYGCAMIMNYISGRLSERYSPAKVFVGLVAFSLPALIATAWLSGIPLLVVAAVYGACALGVQPAENTMVANLSPNRIRSTVYGIKFTLAFGIGGLAAPLVSELLIRTDFATVQLTLAGFVAALLVTTTVLARISSGKLDPRP